MRLIGFDLIGGRSNARFGTSDRLGRLSALLLLTSSLLVTSAYAQHPPPRPGGVTRPADQLLPVPEFEKPATLPPLELPSPLPGVEEEPLPTGLKVFVRKINLFGNTVFSTEELAEVTAAYENRSITSEELEALRHALTLYYVKRGYINSGAVIPDQKVIDGVIRIDLIEGRLTEIEIEGNEKLRSRFVSDRLWLGAGPPLNINTLQEQLQITLQNPRIERINAELRPGDHPGEATLKALVEEGKPYELGFVVDNLLSPSIGEVRGGLRGSIHNLTGWGDTLSAQLGYAEGLDEYYISYDVPLTPRDTRLLLWFDRDESTVIEEPFDELDIESDTETIGIKVEHPFYRSPGQTFTMGLGFEYRKSHSYLLGEGFAFPETGAEPDGKSKVSVLRFSQSWLDRGRDQVIAARSIFSFGIDAFGATVNDSGPSGEFVAWLGQFQWARRIGDQGHQILFRADLQLTNDELLPLERFDVGGMYSVRGYRYNELVRDWGYSTSLEYRIPILRDELGRNELQLAAFADAGGAWNNGRSSPSPRSISSLGLGLLWDPDPKVHAELYWGKTLRNVDHEEHDLQDSGIHFQLSVNLF